MPTQLETIVQRMIDAGESEDNIASVIRSSKSEPQTDSGSLGLAALRPATSLITDMATNPGFAKGAGSLARGATTVGGVIHGIYTGSPSQVLAAPMEGWAAGKGGYWLGKGLQGVAAPVARGLEAIRPLTGPLTVAAGAGDLAQMAEPNRKDIGFLGASLGEPRSEADQAANPALLNLIAQKIQALMGRK